MPVLRCRGDGIHEAHRCASIHAFWFRLCRVRDQALALFSANLDVHDLLLVDDRGRGLSGTIDCPALQHNTAPFAQAEAACAAQLGPAASRYGTGDIAQDSEAVRAPLRYHKVDYYRA